MIGRRVCAYALMVLERDIYSRDDKHKARGLESAQQKLQSVPQYGFGKCERGRKFQLLNCIFTSSTAFPTDKDLPHGHSYYTRAIK